MLGQVLAIVWCKKLDRVRSGQGTMTSQEERRHKRNSEEQVCADLGYLWVGRGAGSGVGPAGMRGWAGEPPLWRAAPVVRLLCPGPALLAPVPQGTRPASGTLGITSSV